MIRDITSPDTESYAQRTNRDHYLTLRKPETRGTKYPNPSRETPALPTGMGAPRHCARKAQPVAYRRRLSLITLALGIAAMMSGLVVNTHPDTYRIGLLVAVVGACGLGGRFGRLVERARQDGYDDGYQDGCDVKRRNVVGLASAGPPLALGGTTEQFGEQRDLGGGSQRVV